MINVADTINVLRDYFKNTIQWSDSMIYSHQFLTGREEELGMEVGD